ncbi:MAG: hypothetical protein IT239_00120 [Bacteroidia bacterium]|nr:hypothetical protein [Bacteroidia bacterium]
MENSNPIIVKSPTSPVTYLFGAAAIGGALFFGYKFYKQQQEKAGEKELDTDAGRIALQLKNLFDSFVVNDADFRRIYTQVNNTNSDQVTKLYRQLTGRNLTDDIASKISSKSVSNAQKIVTYNSKPGGLFKIDENENIVFNIGRNDLIRFMPGQTTPIKAYARPQGIILRELNSNQLIENLKKDPKTAPATVSIDIKPSARVFKVVNTMQIPFESVQRASGWQKYLRFVNTRKVFAAVEIITGVNKKTNKAITAWIDARDMVTFKPQKLSGVIGLAF